ncbi:MAG: saccharopine dehydrogenase NADP-binding domain-containing protein [Solirubrobacterales bacterium]|nr:saccharopine dehydrogenase NADP-binding domain-containing protein [Solirubrobacterales bacterium]
MSLISRQRGPIAVYGATGYTGKLIAAELAASGADFVLAGRSAEKLEALAEDLSGGGVATRAVGLDDPDGLRDLLGDCAAVIACAGPFTLHGEPVLAAAVDTTTHYLDTTGEQTWMRTAFDDYGPRAEAAGTSVIPAMGFDYVPGDMIAALTAQGMGEVDEVVLAYNVAGWGMTRGTQLSGLEMLTGGDVEWRKLRWLPADQSIGRGSFEFPEPIGRRRMIRYPAGEQITVPRHVATRKVRTMITASTLAPSALAPVLPLITRPTRLAMRTPLRKVVGRLIDRLPEGPSIEDRVAARFTIVCDVIRGDDSRRGVIRGSDVYGLTAAAIVRGAIVAARGGVPGSGALAPSQAFEPGDFLGTLDAFDVAWDVQDSDAPVPASATA